MLPKIIKYLCLYVYFIKRKMLLVWSFRGFSIFFWLDWVTLFCLRFVIEESYSAVCKL